MDNNLFKNAKFGDKYKTRDGHTAVFLCQEDNHVHVLIEGDRDATIVASGGSYIAATPCCGAHNIESPQDIIGHMRKQPSSRKYYEERKAKFPDFYKQTYQQNKERHLAACKRYRERNRKKVLEMNKKYREAHKEERKAAWRAWYVKHANTKQSQLYRLLEQSIAKYNQLERAAIHNEEQRKQWGWDMQQLRIKIRAKKKELDKLDK